MLLKRGVIAVMFVAGLSGQPAMAQSRTLKTEQLFDRPSLGAGPNPIRLVIAEGREDDVASFVIVQTFQSLQHSFLNLPRGLAEPLAPGKEYVVDIVQLSDAEVTQHNSKYPQLALPSVATYGISYKIRYEARDKPADRRLLLEVTPILQQRGKGSQWREYKRSYSSEFFGSRVLQRIDTEFAKLRAGAK